jgi:hypothetical protein
LNHGADGLVVGAVHFAGRGDDFDAPFGGQINQLSRFGTSSGHGFVEMDMLVCQNRCPPLGIVHPDWCGRNHHVDAGIGQKVVVIGELLGNAEFFGGGIGSPRSRVADGSQGEPVAEVWLAEVRQNAPS